MTNEMRMPEGPEDLPPGLQEVLIEVGDVLVRHLNGKYIMPEIVFQAVVNALISIAVLEPGKAERRLDALEMCLGDFAAFIRNHRRDILSGRGYGIQQQ